MGRNFNISDTDSTESYLTDFTKAAFTDGIVHSVKCCTTFQVHNTSNGYSN